MSAADAMRQTTMTQCYNNTGPTPGVQTVASSPSPSPVLPAHISCVPPGFHYFAMNGMAYFLNLTTSEKVELGPVESSSLTPIDLDATSSFVTPDVKKESSRAKRNSMVLSENVGDDEEVVYVRRAKKKVKKGESPAGRKLAPQPSEVVELLSQEERGEIDSQADLPQTGNFGSVFEPAAADESDGGETVVEKGDQSPNLLEDDSADSS
jgi:hypothetical protein